MHFKHKYLDLVTQFPPNRRQGVYREATHGTGRALDEEAEYVSQLSWLQQRSQPSSDDRSI